MNTEFVRIIDYKETLEMRVWGAGLGEKLCLRDRGVCGSVAAASNGFAGRSVTFSASRKAICGLTGAKKDNCVYMTGPAAELFQGEVDLELLLNQIKGR